MASDGKRRGGKDVCDVTGGIGDSGIREIETVFFICQDPGNEGRKTVVRTFLWRERKGFFFRLLSPPENKKSFRGRVKRSVNRVGPDWRRKRRRESLCFNFERFKVLRKNRKCEKVSVLGR